MSDTPWLDPLDRLRSSSSELDKVLVHVPASQLGSIAGVLRGVNRQLWRMIDTLEAGRVAYLYKVGGLVRAIADDSGLDHSENWLELAEAGVITLNHRMLLEVARKRGFDVTDYLEEPEDGD